MSASASSERDEHVVSWWATVRAWPSLGHVALVTALVVLVAGGAWMLGTRSESTTASFRGSPPAVSPTTPSEPLRPEQREPAAPPQRDAPAPPRAAPVVVAFSISPIHVRGADEPASSTIPPGTDVVRLHLQGQAGDERLERGRAIVRTVAGQEVWRGRATGLVDSQPSALARIDIPVGRLRADDYIVELLDVETSIRETEQYRYFFSVRGERAKNMP